jgi:hypothetical protein
LGSGITVNGSTDAPADPSFAIEQFGGLWATTPMVMKITSKLIMTAIIP